jgi:hypothetical protein
MKWTTNNEMDGEYLTNHEMDGEYLGPLKKMLEGKLDFKNGK